MPARAKYAHSPVSWEQLWRRIVGETRPVRVDAVLRPGRALGWARNAQPMCWSVWIGG